MTLSFGGGAGVLTIPGVTSDGADGVIVEGAVTAGDAAATVAPTFHRFNGQVLVRDTDGNIADDDIVVDINQQAAMTAGGAGLEAFRIRRQGDISAKDYGHPTFTLADLTASLQAVLRIYKLSGDVFTVGGDGTYIANKLKLDNATTHTLGAYSGTSIGVYDAGGVLQGWIPLYA